MRLSTIGIAMASLTLALMVMACDEMIAPPPQVAGTYEGEMTMTGLLPLKLPATATVTQSGADVTVVLRTTFAGQTSDGDPLKGKIDKDGNVNVTGDSAVVESNQICGAVQQHEIDLRFRDDELRLTSSATTEICGTITATLIAQKT